MSKSQADQRTTRRFSLTLPLSVKFSETKNELPAHTKDVSARGVFFYMDSQIQEGSEIEFTLTLPPEITLTESIRVSCKGKVVRVQSGPGSKIGIAAAIEKYDFVGES